MSSNSSVNLSSLFQNATATGGLTKAAAAVIAVPDLGAQIQAGLGIAADDVEASEVVLMTFLMDDSGSIRFASNAQMVRDGHNLVLDALGESKQKSGILAHTRYLNPSAPGRTHVLFPYVQLANAIRMDSQNYDPNGGTPFYDEAAIVLGTVAAKEQEFRDNGVPCRCITVFVTDSADAGSQRQTAASVKKVVDSLLKTERHIIAGMGLYDGSMTDFHYVFRSMGIRDEWILTPGSSKSEIRKAFLLVSQTATRASQGAKNFSQVSAGGFTSP